MAGKFLPKIPQANAGTGAGTNLGFSTNFTVAPKIGGRFVDKQPTTVGGMISKQISGKPTVFGGPSMPTVDEFKPFSPRVQGETNADYWKGAAENTLPSAGNILGGLYNAVSHPAQTAKSVLELVAGAGVNAGNTIVSKLTGDTKNEVIARGKTSPLYKWMKDKLGLDIYSEGDKAAAVGDFFAQRYGGLENIKKTFKEDPLGIVADVASVFEGGAGIVGKIADISKAGRVVEVANAANTVRKVSTAESIANAANKVADVSSKVNPYNRVPKAAITTAKVPLKLLGATKDFALNQISGLNKETRTFARNNPAITSEAMKGGITAESLANEVKTTIDDINTNKTAIGKEYDKIRQSGATVDTAGVTAATNTKLQSLGVNVVDGNLQFSKFSKFNTPQQKALQSAYNIMMDVENAGKITADDLLNIRQKMDDLISWDGKPLKGSAVDKSTELAIREMRQNIDNYAKTIPGLSELDAKYGSILDEVGGLKKDWFDNQGNLKENALSKIRNLTSDANKAKMARLEAVMPGITQKSQALQAVMDIERATGSKVGTYVRGAILGGGSIAALMNPALLVPLIVGGVIFTPKNIIKIYQTLGKVDKTIEAIGNKLTAGTKLTVADEAYMKNFMEKNKPQVNSAIQQVNGTTPTVNPATKLGGMIKGEETLNKYKGAITKGKTTAEEIQKFAADNRDEFANHYMSDPKNKLGDALVIDTDGFRKYLGEQGGIPASLTHEGSSDLQKYVTDLAKSKLNPGDEIIMLGGASGVGKGYVSKKGYLGDISNAKLVLDKTLSDGQKAINLYKSLKSEGFNPRIEFVYNSQEQAWKQNIERFINGRDSAAGVGRKVPYKASFVPSHEGYIDTMIKMRDEKIPFKITANGNPPTSVNVGDLDSLVANNKKLSWEEAKSQLNNYMKMGKLSPDEFKGFMSLLFALGIGGFAVGGSQG